MSLRWLLLALLPSVLGIVLSSVSLNRQVNELDAGNHSVAENGGPSVIHLSALQRELGHIEVQTLLARPESLHEDRARIVALMADLDRADAAYHAIVGRYPGELEAYQAVEEDRVRFFAAVDRLLDSMGDGRPADPEARANVVSTADGLSASLERLIKVNADEVIRTVDSLGALRHHAFRLASLRALAFAVAVTLILLQYWSARRDAGHAQELRRLDQQRADELDAFAGRVAHDLRDVLGTILMRAGLAEKAQTLEVCRKELGLIVAKAQRMSDMLTALLKFARSAGQADPDARCEVDAVVQQVVAEVQPLAAEAGAEIVVEPIRPAVVACDGTVLSVVFSNLVRNAIKYIGSGRDNCRRITLREHEGEGCLRFEVEDTGPGLPPGSEEQIFEPFVRLPQAKGRAGVGLGLATVKRLVVANGGEVGVVSAPGAGARFWFTLPLPA